jgi:UDP-glucuronate 4-epimerase
MSKCVFITGAAGFVGSRLARTLLEQGCEVVGFDNLNDYYPVECKRRNLADLELASRESGSRFSFIEGDLRDLEKITSALKGARASHIAHLAAMAAVRYSVQHPLVYGEVNVQGTLNLMDAARTVGIENCVIASTGSVYGADTPTPFKEEASAAKPLAPYPASKRAMEMFCHSYSHVYGLNISVMRFFNVYGPHGRPDMMPWQWSLAINQGREITLFNAGHMKRDWTYVDDIVDGFVRALSKVSRFEIFNLGCGSPVENIEFVKIIEQLLNKKAVIKDVPAPISEPIVTWADVSKAQAILGYQPKTKVDKGMGVFIDWLRKERILE